MDGPVFGDSSGLPIGIRTGAQYENRALPMGAGSRLFLFSDGASELWTDDDQVLGEEGLAEIVTSLIEQQDDDHFLNGILEKLRSLGSFNDDVTALVLKRLS